METTHAVVFFIISIATSCYIMASIGKKLQLKKKNDEFMYALLIGLAISIGISFWFGRHTDLGIWGLSASVLGPLVLIILVMVIIGNPNDAEPEDPASKDFDVAK